MLYAHQISSQLGTARREDLVRSARIRHIRKVTRTRNAQVRPQRRWMGLGARQTTCPTAA